MKVISNGRVVGDLTNISYKNNGSGIYGTVTFKDSRMFASVAKRSLLNPNQLSSFDINTGKGLIQGCQLIDGNETATVERISTTPMWDFIGKKEVDI